MMKIKTNKFNLKILTMGSYNGTCALSNLPILEGEKVKLLFLLPKTVPIHVSGMSGICNVTDFLNPFVLPLSGEYNGSSQVDDIICDWNFDAVEYIIKDYLGESIIVDGDVLKEYNLYDVIDGIDKETLRYYKLNNHEKHIDRIYNKESIGDGEIRKSLLCYVLIRDDVWNSICKEYEYSSYDNYQNKFTKHDFHLQCFNSMIEIVENQKSFKYMEADFFYNYFDKPLSFIQRMDNSCYMNMFSGNKEYMIINSDFYKQWSEFKTIVSFFESIKKTWMVQTKGSQSENFKNYKLLSEITLKICENKN